MNGKYIEQIQKEQWRKWNAMEDSDNSSEIFPLIRNRNMLVQNHPCN